MKFKNKLELKGAIIGMLLGDACIPKLGVRGKTHRLTMKQKSAHREYFLMKKDILENVTSVKVYLGEQSERFGKILFSDRLSTLSNPLYCSLRDRMYHDGRRTADEHVMGSLTPLGLALWYQDDGHYSSGSGSGDMILCTDAYSKTECEMMARALQKKFGLQWRVYRHSRKNGEGEKSFFYRLHLRKKDHENFVSIIQPFVADCMKYKIHREDVSIQAFRGTRKESLVCAACGNEFQRFKSLNAKYCSKECFLSVHQASKRDTAQAEEIVYSA